MSFEEALRASEELLQSIDENGGSDDLLAELKSMLKTQASCRGFFVSFLTGDSKLADEPPPYLIEALAESEEAPELLVKNLVMSTCMQLTHLRKGEEKNAEGSAQVARRTEALLRKLKSECVHDKIVQMRSSIKLRTGVYADFLKRWSYDDEQLGKALISLEALL